MTKLVTRKQVAKRFGVGLTTLDRRWRLTPGYEASYDPKFPKPELDPTGKARGWHERDLVAFENNGRLPVQAPTGMAASLDETGEFIEITYRVPVGAVGDLVADKLLTRFGLDSADGEVKSALHDAFVKPTLIEEITNAVNALRQQKAQKPKLPGPIMRALDGNQILSMSADDLVLKGVTTRQQ